MHTYAYKYICVMPARCTGDRIICESFNKLHVDLFLSELQRFNRVSSGASISLLPTASFCSRSQHPHCCWRPLMVLVLWGGIGSLMVT